MNEPIWLSSAVTVAIHRRQLAEHGGSDGIRDRGLLASALHRPKNQFFYGNPHIFDLAAAYGYGIAKNHPFVDGNKRTSYVVARTFLKLNGCDLQASATEKYQVWLQLASEQLTQTDLADWIAKNILVSSPPKTLKSSS